MLHNSLLHKSSSLTNINFTAFTWNPVNGIIFLRRVSNTLLAILAWSPTLVLKLLGKIFYVWLSCKRWNLKVGSALVVGFCPQYSQNRWEMFLLLWDGRGFFLWEELVIGQFGSSIWFFLMCLVYTRNFQTWNYTIFFCWVF